MGLLEEKLKKLDAYRKALLVQIYMSGEINGEAKEFLPGIHFCPNFDQMAIHNESPEKEFCDCADKLKGE